MPAVRLSMRKIREVLRLKFDSGQTNRRIARSCHISRPTVADYLLRFEEAGLEWPATEALDDTTLEHKLFPPAPVVSTTQRTVPDWGEVHRELRRKGVTLTLLWHEYKVAHPEGYQYSWFCDQYRAWAGQLDVVMRQEHRAGEKLFVDYAGQTVGVVDRATCEVKEAQIFVAVLAASWVCRGLQAQDPPKAYPRVNLSVSYQVDPDWPQRPEGVGWAAMSGVAVDRKDQVWLYTRAKPPVQVYRFDGSQLSPWFDLEAFDGLTHGTTVTGGLFGE